jgi:hypothetical protein
VSGEEYTTRRFTLCVTHQISLSDYKTEIGRECSAYGGRRGAFGVLVGKPEKRRPLGKPRLEKMIIL